MQASERPRAPGGEPVRVLAVPPNVPLVVRFLGPVQGLITHWASGRSFPCPGADLCPNTLHRARSVWKGYAPVEGWSEIKELWHPAVLEVTEVLEECLRGRRLRGEVWLLRRTVEKKKSSPVNGLYCETLKEGTYSPAFDILPALLRFYHVQNLALGVPNPLPPKLVLPAVAGARPNLPAELAPAAPAEVSVDEKRRVSEMLGRMTGRIKPARPAPAPSGNGDGAGH